MKYNSIVNIKVPKKDKVEGFDPDMLSVIFAINSESLESDLEVIKTFSNEPVTILQGRWEGEIEWSYQVSTENLSYPNFLKTMNDTKQDSFIYLGLSREAWLCDTKYENADKSLKYLGTMQEIDITASDGNVTYCPTTNKYWRAF